jgi:hypothetical protein
MIEAWDLELGLRKLAQRLQSLSSLGIKTLTIVCMSIAMYGLPQQSNAEEKKAAEEIKKVLAAEEFGGTKEERRWVLRDMFQNKKEQPPLEMDWLHSLSEGAARVVQLVGWIILVLGALYLLRALWRAWPASALEDGDPIPEQLFGMDITPESLPDDVAGAALALAEQGRLRQALSLLYRGTLSALVYVCRLPIRHSDTEGDVMRHGKTSLTPTQYEYLEELIRLWSWVAYAHRPLQAEQVMALTRGYPSEWNRARIAEVMA